jgi:SAM-dependent methyltransferase
MGLPYESGYFDAVVSGLVLNFVPEPATAVSEMVRVTKTGGVTAAYVWDYAGGMQVTRHFWEAAVMLNPSASELDEGGRFPLCKPEPLRKLFREAGLESVETRAIEVPAVFQDFDDYWSPFLGGQGPAPGYAMSLDEGDRAELRELIRGRLPMEPDGSIRLVAGAWAARGRR